MKLPSFSAIIPLSLLLTFTVACGALESSSPKSETPQSQDTVLETTAQSAQVSSQAPDATDPQPQTSIASASNKALDATDPQPQTSIASASNKTPCITWSEYQTSTPSGERQLKMPPGFDQGCVFKSGANGNSTYILSNDVSIEEITVSGVSVSDDIPWFQGNELNRESFENHLSNGNVLTYYAACTTLGGQLSNCDGFPENEAYIIRNDTACYKGRCLVVPNTHAIYLLGLWTWDPEFESYPTSFSSEQTLARQQYRTVPINQLPPRTPLISRFPTQIATAAFGRTALEEGEQPTSTIGPEWNDDDRVWVVYLTNQGSADDSVGGYRYRLDFTSIEAEQSKLLWVGEQQYCRRTEEWTSNELCP